MRCDVYTNKDGRTTLPIQLDPSGSIFILFREAAAGPRIATISRDGVTLTSVAPLSANNPPSTPAGNFPRGGQLPLALPQPAPLLPVELTAGAAPVAWQTGSYELRGAQGQTRTVHVDGIAEPVEVGGPWRVTFQAKHGAPPEAAFEKLISWPDSTDSGIQYYSGTATYSRKLSIPAEALAKPKRLFLDLGRVQVLAEVRLNGKELGTLWTFPFRVDITDAAHAGDNDLEIRVTNLWPNRLIGDEQRASENEYVSADNRGGRSGRGPANSITRMPDWYMQGLAKPTGGRVTFTTWHHWNANDKLLESGLIGPVLLRTAIPLGE